MHPTQHLRRMIGLLIPLLWAGACDQSVDPGAQDSSVADSAVHDTVQADGAATSTDTGATPDASGSGDQAIVGDAATNTVKVTYKGNTTVVDLEQPTPVTFEGAPHALLSDVVALGIGGKVLDSLQADFTSSDGFNPGSKSFCADLVPVAGNLLDKGYIDVATHRLRWDAALQYPNCLYVKDLAEITITDK
jgi:hypothetical protein